MSTPNYRKIFNVHSRVLQRCRALASKQSKKYFVLALRSAEAFCQGLDPSKGNEHYGLTAQEAAALTESQFEELYRLLLSYYAVAHYDETSLDAMAETEKVIGADYLQKMQSSGVYKITDLTPGFTMNDLRAGELVVQIIGGRQHNLLPIRETLHYTAYKMLRFSLQNAAKGGCFVATSVYGSHDHPNVIKLQQFRDRHLLTNVTGRKLVAGYYQVGPTLARFISVRPKLHSFSKAILDAMVSVIR